ncbi:MAG: YicC/YloC family endoribonuclease [Chordicoccus sp.]
MICSMTGFGRAEAADETRKLTVEIKSVNNRYLDFNIRMPKSMSSLETKIRDVLKEYMTRGKVDVFITDEEQAGRASSLRYNEAMAAAYVRYMRQMAEKFGLDPSIRVSDVASAPDVFTLSEEGADAEELWKSLEPVVREAADTFRRSRTREGERLKDDLLGKLAELKNLAEEVKRHEPEILTAYRERLEETLAGILADRSIDETRIAAECVVYADKICTDEECVRLLSHIRQMTEDLTNGGAVGRKLDFLAQEMNREANTTLSKAGDIVTADIGIAMKTVIEKLREQIQNIE